MSRLSTTANRFRAEVLDREREAATRMVERYGSVYTTLSEELDLLTAEIIRLVEVNETVTRDMIYRRTRIQTLLLQIDEQVTRFAEFAEPEVASAQAFAINKAQEAARALIFTALGPIPEGVTIPQNFLRFNPRVVEQFLGFASNGSPLADLFATLTTEPIAAVEDVFVKGIVAGKNPREVAKELRDTFKIPLNRAEVIARTTILESYRETNREYYEQNNRVVVRWRWQAAFNARTCAMCLAMDGKEFETNEKHGTHPNCRCVLVPVTRTWEELGFNGIKTRRRQPSQTGQEWFSKQSPEVQRAVLGKGKYKRYIAGKLTLEDTIGFRVDPDWGDTRWERSLKQIDAGAYVVPASKKGYIGGK